MLISDMSGSIRGNEDFVYNALNVFINRFDLSEDGIRIGYITFSDNATLMSKFTISKENLVGKFNLIKLYGANGDTRMEKAFQLAQTEIMNNGRPMISTIVVMISDGEPNSKDESMNMAMLLKSLPNTNICGVYIDKSGGDANFLKEISSEFCYVESDFKNLVNELKKMDICM